MACSPTRSELGWRVTAVDARDERFPDDESIDWVVTDVREFDGYGVVDVVACLGLWYHLTLQDQLQLAARTCPVPLIIDTHVARVRPASLSTGKRLSALAREPGGYEGFRYDESGLGGHATASWGNDVSFWPTVATLEREVYEAGYDVLEQYSPPYLPDRGFFLARALAADVPARVGQSALTLAPRLADIAPPTDEPTPRSRDRPMRVPEAARQFLASLVHAARWRLRRAAKLLR